MLGRACIFLMTERGVLWYQPSCHYCLQMAKTFKFIAVKVCIHQWKTLNTQWATESSYIIPTCVDPSTTTLCSIKTDSVTELRKKRNFSHSLCNFPLCTATTTKNYGCFLINSLRYIVDMLKYICLVSLNYQ